jgi:hypothetical protein
VLLSLQPGFTRDGTANALFFDGLINVPNSVVSREYDRLIDISRILRHELVGLNKAPSRFVTGMTIYSAAVSSG